MKKFLLKIGLFFVVLFMADRILGMVFCYLGEHSKGGYIGHHKYVTDKVSEEILIFGSSRAIHHYNPQIISDSLGLSCYNCGQNGNGIILFYGLWQMIKQYHKPKMIIYDVTTDFDIYKGDNNQRYLGWLRADYDRDGIKEIFSDVDPYEHYKMMSMLYRYNSKFMQIITDYVHPIFAISSNGFLPLKGEMDKLKISKKTKVGPFEVDSMKIKYLNRLIDETEGVRLIFVASPSWHSSMRDRYKTIRDICYKRNIPFVDFSRNSQYVHNDSLFKDGEHLNSKGADCFTRDFVKLL